MKAVTVGPEQSLELREVAEPTAGAGRVVVDVAGGIGRRVGIAFERREPSGQVTKPGEKVAVAGPEGRPIVCDDGEPLLIDPVADDPPRDLIQTRATSDPSVLETVEGAVPRCGPEGGGPDASPVWVPESVGVEHPVDAPQRYVAAQAGS